MTDGQAITMLRSWLLDHRSQQAFERDVNARLYEMQIKLPHMAPLAHPFRWAHDRENDLLDELQAILDETHGP